MNRKCGWIAMACMAIVLLVPRGSAHAADADVLSAGTWTKKSNVIEGSWKLVRKEGGLFVVLGDGFKTRKAPDLKMFLSPTPLAELSGANATSGSLLLGELRSNKGQQEFAIPADADLSKYATVIIHCEKYAKLWGGAVFQAPPE